MIRNEHAGVCTRCCIPKEKRHLGSKTHTSWGDLIDFENTATAFTEGAAQKKGVRSWILLIQCLEKCPYQYTAFSYFGYSSRFHTEGIGGRAGGEL